MAPMRIELDVRGGGGDRFDIYVTAIDDGKKRLDDPVISEKPVQDFTMTPRGPTDPRTNPDGLLTQADLTESFFFLLPEAPTGQVVVRKEWVGTRVLPIGQRVPEHPDVELRYRILRFERCPAGVEGQCAVYSFHGETGPVKIGPADAPTAKYEYSFEGVGRFAVAGHFVDSQGRMGGQIWMGDEPPVELVGTMSLTRE